MPELICQEFYFERLETWSFRKGYYISEAANFGGLWKICWKSWKICDQTY